MGADEHFKVDIEKSNKFLLLLFCSHISYFSYETNMSTVWTPHYSSYIFIYNLNQEGRKLHQDKTIGKK